MPPYASESYPLPFALDLGLTLGPLQRGSTDPTISFDGDEVWRAARTPAGPATLHLHLAGARVVADGWGAGAAWAVEHVPALLGFDDQPESFRPANPMLLDLHRRHPGLRLGRTQLVFESLLPTILEQKVPGVAAWRSYGRLVRALGEPAPGPASLLLRSADAPAPDRGDLRGFLRRLKVRVHARGVVGGIDHLGDLGNRGLDGDLDPLPQRYVDLRAPLAAAAQLHIGRAVAHLEQVDIAAMGRDRGIDLPVEHLLHPGCHRIAPAFVGILDPQRPTHDRGVEVNGRAVEIRRAARLDQNAEVRCLNHDVTGRRVHGGDQVQLVGELATPPAGDRDSKAGIRVATLGADAIDLGQGRGRDRDHGRHSAILFVVN